MKWKTQITISLFVTTILLLCFSSTQKILAATSTNVDATIKISVCGNATAENGEDCDNTDLKGKNCQNFGFAGGALRCDASCSFETSACIAATPTPTAIPVQAATEIPKQTPIAEPTITELLPTVIPTPPSLPDEFITTILAPITAFPAKLFYFGADKNGNITHAELRESVQLWVTHWQSYLSSFSIKNGKALGQASSKECDINNDHVCNLVDLSVMLYHVQK